VNDPNIIRTEYVELRYPDDEYELLEYLLLANFEKGKFHHYSLWKWEGDWEKSQCLKVFDAKTTEFEARQWAMKRLKREVETCKLKGGVVVDSTQQRNAPFNRQFIELFFKLFEK